MTTVPSEAPAPLRSALAGHDADFVVLAGQAVSRYQAASLAVMVAFAIVLGVTLALDAAGPSDAGWGSLAIFAAFVVLLALSVGRLLVEARAGPAWWAGTEAALVRVRGAEVRTIPWSEFRSVIATRGRDGRASAFRRTRDHDVPHARSGNVRGTVYLIPRPAFVVGPLGRSVAALEGPVRFPGRMGLALLDVDSPREIEAACNARIAAARAQRG